MFTFRSGDPVALVVDQPAHLGEVAVPLDQPVQHGGLTEEGVVTCSTIKVEIKMKKII